MVGLPLLLSLTALAGDPGGVVLLDLGDDPVEDALRDELRLAGVDVAEEAGPDGFSGRALPGQLDAVRGELVPGRAVAWVTTEEDAVHLAVAFISEERAVVRTVRSERDTGAAARLAVAAREILEVASGEPTIEPPEVSTRIPHPPGLEAEAGRVVMGEIGGGVDLPSLANALGPRLVVDTAVFGSGERVDLGVGLGGGGNLRQGRGHVRAFVRLGPRSVGLRLGAALDVAALPWVIWAQPRLELALTPPLRGPLIGQVMVRLAPVRDVVKDGHERVYDSGVVEIGLRAFFRRQIRRP